MKKRWLDFYKNITLEVAALSTCASKQVGAILIRDRRILCTGYNGTPSGKPHCTSIFNKKEVQSTYHHPHHEWSIKNEIHAEIALLGYAGQQGVNTKDATLFVSLSPCIHCAKAIIAAGISHVYFIYKYERDTRGIDFLKNNNITIEQI